MTTQPNNNLKLYLALAWLLISIISRVMPHPFNATPLISFSLCAPYFFSRKQSFWLVLGCMCLSDITLSMIKGYPLLGSWSLFTYSGLLCLTLANSFHKRMPKLLQLLLITLTGTFGFWLWTNFGTWVTTSDLYPHTLIGLYQCYYAGLPFLSHNLMASAIWSSGIAISYRAYHPHMKHTSIKH